MLELQKYQTTLFLSNSSTSRAIVTTRKASSLEALFSGQNPPARTTVGYSYMLRGDALVNNDDPSGGLSGIFDQEGPHIMILFPTTDEIADLPRDPNAGGPYVMWDLTPLVHVMIPMTDRDR